MRIVIVGGGPAGVTVTETVRTTDRKTELLVFSAEPYPPYAPPALADHYIHNSQAHLWRGEDWADRLGVDYRSGVQVVGLEPGKHRLRLADGTWQNYDRLVIASGSRLYAPLQGADLPGVYNFKSLSAAEALMGRVRRGEAHSALIVGAGFIGMEIALLLREAGVSVTQVEMTGQVMPRMLDLDTADIALDLMRQRDMEVRLNTKAVAFTGNGKATGVQLESGEVLEADLLIAATGVRPNLEWLEGSGISCRWGVSVDDHLRVNEPDIYAAGDVVEAPDLLTGEPFVHAIFPNAVEQGKVVGLNLLGYDVVYQGAERMNSLKHLGLPVMAAGLKEGDEVLQIRRDGGLRTLYLQDHRLVGFQLVNDIRSAGVLRTLINTRRDLRHLKDRLLDPNFGQGYLAWQAIEG